MLPGGPTAPHRGSSGHPESIFGYEVIGRLGLGAGSSIYAVCQRGSNELFALKHVICRTQRDRRFLKQLANEYEVGRQVNAPNLRRSVELRTRHDWLGRVCQSALLLELCDGTPLDEQLPRGLVAVLDCFTQVARALHALHALGIVHCDLKPNNILLNAGGQVKVIDLGQACPVGLAKERIQGTPDYIAPEQVRCLPVTPRTDVFNFGATLYWCLTGRHLPTLYRLNRVENSFLVDDRFTPPDQINASVPGNLSQFVMECIRTNPAHRPEDTHELIRRLEVIRYTLRRDTGGDGAADTTGTTVAASPAERPATSDNAL